MSKQKVNNNEEPQSNIDMLNYLSRSYEGLKTNADKRLYLSSLFGWYMSKKGNLDYETIRDVESNDYRS